MKPRSTCGKSKRISNKQAFVQPRPSWFFVLKNKILPLPSLAPHCLGNGGMQLPFCGSSTPGHIQILKGLLFLLVSACDLAKEIESISHKNRTTQMKAAASQLTLLRADQLSQATLPNSTHNSTPSSQSADNLRLHTVSVLTSSTNATTENGDESYLQIAEPKRSFDEDTDTIVSREGVQFPLLFGILDQLVLVFNVWLWRFKAPNVFKKFIGPCRNCR